MSPSRAILFVALSAFIVRSGFILAFPFGGGDWDIYSTVAENILRGCGVSLSPPDGLNCQPHFGGNHLPGFPFFAAMVWRLSGHADMAIRFAQLVCYVGSLAWLVRAVHLWSHSIRNALIVGLVMALSPLQMAWPRYTQTETLALASVIFVMAEIMLSLHERKLRILSLGLALSFAVFIRLDGILLTVPVAVAAFAIHRPLVAIKRGLLVALILATPLAGWTARNVYVGLESLLPPPMVLPRNAPAPKGYLAWGATWITEEYQRMGWAWALNRMIYDKIEIDPRAYASEAEKQRVEGMLKDLAVHTGQPFPPDIDLKFRALAEERTAEAPFRVLVVLPFKRALALWGNPFSSFGWPNELPSAVGHQQRLDASRGLGGVLTLALEYPGRAFSKAFTAVYRFALLAGFAAAIIYSFSIRFQPLRSIIWITAAWVFARTGFFAITNNIETRYTVPLTPAIELVVTLSVLLVLATRPGSQSQERRE